MSVASPQPAAVSSHAKVSTVRSALAIQCLAPLRGARRDWSENHASASAEMVSKLLERKSRKFFPFQAYSWPMLSTQEESASQGGLLAVARGARARPGPSGSRSRNVHYPLG